LGQSLRYAAPGFWRLTGSAVSPFGRVGVPSTPRSDGTHATYGTYGSVLLVL
jgi:hypothetical protein